MKPARTRQRRAYLHAKGVRGEAGAKKKAGQNIAPMKKNPMRGFTVETRRPPSSKSDTSSECREVGVAVIYREVIERYLGGL